MQIENTETLKSSDKTALLTQLQEFMQTKEFQKLENSIKVAENDKLTVHERYTALKFISEYEYFFYLLKMNTGQPFNHSYDFKDFFVVNQVSPILTQKLHTLNRFMMNFSSKKAQLYYDNEHDVDGFYIQKFSIAQMEEILIFMSVENEEQFYDRMDYYFDFRRISFKKSPFYKFRMHIKAWLHNNHRMKLCSKSALKLYKKTVVDKYATSISFCIDENAEDNYYYSSSGCEF